MAGYVSADDMEGADQEVGLSLGDFGQIHWHFWKMQWYLRQTYKRDPMVMVQPNTHIGKLRNSR